LIFQETLPWQPIKVEKLAFFPHQSTLSRCHSETDCNIAILISKRCSRMNFSTLCAVLVAFGPETSELTTLTIAPFAAIWQKLAYHAKYLRMSWTCLFYRFGKHISGDDFQNIRLAVAQGTLLWQPVKYGRCSQTLRGITFTFCFDI